MPSPFTSSFASAAAGNTSHDGARSAGGGDWPRTRPNGATQTFRRPSGTSSFTQRENSQPTPTPSTTSSSSAYVPPHLLSTQQSGSGRNGGAGDSRYSKEQLLEVFRTQKAGGQANVDVSELFVDGWSPTATNGTENGGWSRRDEHRDVPSADVCWDREGSVQPLNLTGMTEEENEIFSTSVNSTLKTGPGTNKDGTPRENLNRRTSITQAQNSTNSPLSRPTGRRRESTDLAHARDPPTPSATNRFSREEGSSISSPPPSLLRRKTDFRDNFGSSSDQKDTEAPKQHDTSSPFSSLKRTNTQPASAGLNGPSSPWSNAPQSAGFAPMGAFGSFAAIDSSSSERRAPFGGGRSESRFKGLMSASNLDNSGSSIKEKSSQGNLTSLAESTHEEPSGKASAPSQRGKRFDEDDEAAPSGSAALGGDDASPQPPSSARFRGNETHNSYDDIGFSSVGMSGEMPFRDLMQRQEYSHHQQPPSSRGQGGFAPSSNESMSPTGTNPYQSPEGEKAVPGPLENEDSDFRSAQFHGSGAFGQPTRNVQNAFDAQDRNQAPSGGSRGFSGLGGLGSLTGLSGANPWSAAPGAIGTPTRAQPGQTPGFADASFAAFGDSSSPAHAGFASGGFFGPPGGNPPTTSRGSKLGSLFPSSGQDHGSNEGQRPESLYKGTSDIFPRAASGFGSDTREVDTPHNRNSHLEEYSANEKRASGAPSFSSSMEKDNMQPPSSAGGLGAFSGTSPGAGFMGRSQEHESVTPSSQLPATQQRQMVMPDRMRWIYRDPQGNTQGPWSGLEMHDWYKAGFFSPELQVKKLEDTEYEPLAQLIRRIGNSREPFLVPQIGIPHGSPGPHAPGAGKGPAVSTGAAQPPFANSFPSFGTTLTAEQQNALERRKQEEQYLMARQKEYLAQHQSHLKLQQQMGGMHPQQLHHQSSGHSLHSQPSFGSITSPTAYQNPLGSAALQTTMPGPGFFEGQMRGNAESSGPNAHAGSREEEMSGYMDRLNMGRGNQQQPPPQQQQQFFNNSGQDHQHQVQAMLQDRARLSKEQEQFDLMQRGNDNARASTERLSEYNQLRSQEGEGEPSTQHLGTIGGQVNRLSGQTEGEYGGFGEAGTTSDARRPEPLSLAEQVQKAAAKQQPSAQPQSPWAKIDSGVSQHLPPPQSSSPMPAPTPQRNRQSVAEALNAESQSPSQSESAETPSATVAPWAKENSETTKGPSLKEIQAMEAQKAARQEELQAAARRALAEQERLTQQTQTTASAPQPGLPSSANWASSVTPAVPAATTGPSPWARNNTAGKPAVATPVSAAKKTLAQIQKEEEAKKNRAAAAAAAAASTAAPATAGSNAAVTAAGKRYADLAGRPGQSQPAPNPNNAAWTTVGAGGKAKTPAPVGAPGLSARSASGNIVPIASTAASKSKTSSAMPGKTSQQVASEELQKWTKSALSKGLDSKIAVDGFVASLLDLPPETDIISDSIYANSTTLDGRRFAEEFLRRRKLADRGIVPDPAPSGASPASMFSASGSGGGASGEGKGGNGGGWSEVAKKGGASGATGGSAGGDGSVGGGSGAGGSNFRVVSGKKKVGKR